MQSQAKAFKCQQGFVVSRKVWKRRPATAVPAADGPYDAPGFSRTRTCSVLLRAAVWLAVCYGLCAAPEVRAGQTSTDLPFSVTGASMWGPGPAFSFNKSEFIGIDVDQNISFEETILDTTLDTIAFGISGNIKAKVGLEASFTLDSGTVDVSYPAAASISFPDVGQQGTSVTVATTASMSSPGTLTTRSPQASAALKLPFQLSANASGFINPPVASEIPFTLITPFNFDATHTFFDISTGDADFTIQFPTVDIPGIGDKGAFGSITASIPTINTQEMGSGGMITSNGSDSIIDLNLDLDAVASLLIPQIPDLSGSITVPFSGGVGVSYDLLDIDGGLMVNATQDFKFNSDLMARYTLETGQVIVQSADAPLTISLPDAASVGGALDVGVEYFLQNSLRNDTGIALVPSLTAKLFTGSADFGSLGSFSIGPVFGPQSISTSIPFNVFNNQFALDFPEFTTSFSITIVPEPSAFVLGGLAVTLLLAMRLGSRVGRRRRAA